MAKKKKTDQKLYLGIITVLIVVVVALSFTLIQNTGKQGITTQIQIGLPPVEGELKTNSEVKAASDETLTSISEIKTLLDGITDVLEEK